LALVFVGYLPAAVGAAGGLVGGLVTGELCRRTLARGGTRGATALLLILGGGLIAGIAFVPAAGYVEALAMIVFGLLQRRRGRERFAGLRTLAKD
jgi:hypothetical protein